MTTITSTSHDSRHSRGGSVIVGQGTKNSFFATSITTIAIAQSPYHSFNPSHLCFMEGDIIFVVDRGISGYWQGWTKDKRGWFPSNLIVELFHTSSMDPLIEIANLGQQYDLLIELGQRIIQNLYVARDACTQVIEENIAMIRGARLLSSRKVCPDLVSILIHKGLRTYACRRRRDGSQKGQ